MAQFSTYNFRQRPPWSGHPLADLLPEDPAHGWPVARHPLKPLNHLGFLQEKERLAQELNLHNLLTPVEVFDVNYELLAAHQAREASTDQVTQHLASQLQAEGKSVTPVEVREKLASYARVRHMEFHPTDVCNLRCRGCTYQHDRADRKPAPVVFPFAGIAEIARLQPWSLVVCGGGEPTLYKDGKQRFPDLVEQLEAISPGLRLALITNGTRKPRGDWPDRFNWIRLSLDAATASTYDDFRSKPYFEEVLRNYLLYLNSSAHYVGLGFLFARANIREYAAVARLIFTLVSRKQPQHLAKVNVQYRPLRQDPHQLGQPFAEAITGEEIAETVAAIRVLAATSLALKSFLRQQTNITAVLGGNKHQPHRFRRCYYSQIFTILRASGDLFPCFIRVQEPQFALGNLLTDRPETIGLNLLYVGARRRQYCDPWGCRQSHVNYILEQGLRGVIQPSNSAKVQADPMF